MLRTARNVPDPDFVILCSKKADAALMCKKNHVNFSAIE
jgi:hypothetical protein